MTERRSKGRRSHLRSIDDDRGEITKRSHQVPENKGFSILASGKANPPPALASARCRAENAKTNPLEQFAPTASTGLKLHERSHHREQAKHKKCKNKPISRSGAECRNSLISLENCVGTDLPVREKPAHLPYQRKRARPKSRPSRLVSRLATRIATSYATAPPGSSHASLAMRGPGTPAPRPRRRPSPSPAARPAPCPR